MRIHSLHSLFPCIIYLIFNIHYEIQAQGIAACNKVVVGYWHSFDNQISTVIKLRDVPCHYNVVNVAFLEGASHSDPTIVFRLDTISVEKESEFINDVKILKGRGVKVLASIGGANGAVSLPDENAKTKFVNSLIAIIDKYGFEGLDIDIEGGAVSLISGDNNYQNPTTPVIKNLISAMKILKAKYGSNFWITMAPEVAYVQGATAAYGSIWGAYLPLIYGLRNELDYIHVQYYNTGGTVGLDGNSYNQGTADFIVAMNDMLLSGFKIANGQSFPGLRENQVAFGLPAVPAAAPAGGYVALAEVTKALNYLTKGTSYGGKYKLSKTYPGIRGIMTWSINWDKKLPGNYAWSKTFSQYFCNSTNLCSSVTNIGERDSDGKSVFFPNPASGKIYLEETTSFEKIEFFNVMGVMVKRMEYFRGDDISIDDLPHGTYFIFASNKEVIIKQSIVKH